MSFPEEIRRTRQRGFLTRGNFAKEVNVAFSTVNKWESRKAKPILSAIKNGTDYSPIEEAWLDYTAEVKQ